MRKRRWGKERQMEGIKRAKEKGVYDMREPQPNFGEKKNPNLLIYNLLGFLLVVPPGLEPGTN